jgi:hypothetical protein
MNIEKTSFGGLLLHTSHGNFAVNGGGSMEDMEIGYRLREQPLRGLILTAEHIHRSRNAAAFANRFGIPVLISTATWAVLGEHLDRPVLFSPPGTVDFEGLSLEFHFLRYDSIDPVYLIVRDRKNTVGIVPDGKLTAHTAEPLRHCSALCLDNRPHILPGIPSALKRRLLSVTNTAEEIDRLFPDTANFLL